MNEQTFYRIAEDFLIVKNCLPEEKQILINFFAENLILRDPGYCFDLGDDGEIAALYLHGIERLSFSRGEHPLDFYWLLKLICLQHLEYNGPCPAYFDNGTEWINTRTDRVSLPREAL